MVEVNNQQEKQEEQEQYYVYAVRLDNELVYLGKGKGTRCKHITSGTSHCYEANQAWFSHKLLGTSAPVVSIEAYFDSEEDCLEAEELMIQTCKPAWNKHHTGRTMVSKPVRIIRNGRIKEAAANRRESLQEERFNIVVKVLEAKLANKGKKKVDRQDIESILTDNGISEPTFSRYKREFRTELKELGLLNK